LIKQRDVPGDFLTAAAVRISDLAFITQMRSPAVTLICINRSSWSQLIQQHTRMF